MLEKISLKKLNQLETVSIDRVGAYELEKYGFTMVGMSLFKDKDIALADGECGYINEKTVVRIESSRVYLHTLKAKKIPEKKPKVTLNKKKKPTDGKSEDKTPLPPTK